MRQSERTLELGRGNHLDVHDRFQNCRLGLLERIPDRSNGSDHESHLGRINRVEPSVLEHVSDTGDGRSTKRSLLTSLFETLFQKNKKDQSLTNGLLEKSHRAHTNLFDSRDEAVRDRTRDNPRLELDVFAGLRVNLHRLNVTLHLGVLSGSSRLLLMDVLKVGPLGNRLPERYSGFTGRALDVVLSLQSLDVDLEVEFSHSGNNRLQLGY